MLDAEVVIAGAGPVGMTAALVLAKKGIGVKVLEAGGDLRIDSRASTVHAATLELLDELGVAWEVIRQGEIVPRILYRDRKTGPVAEFDFRLISDYTKFPIRMQTDQSRITRIIRERLKAFPSASLEFNRPVTAVRILDDGSVVTTAGHNVDQEEYRSRYLIGADGAHSVVRKSLVWSFLAKATSTGF